MEQEKIKTIVMDTFSDDPDDCGAEGAILYITPDVLRELLRARQAFNVAKEVEPDLHTIQIRTPMVDFCKWDELGMVDEEENEEPITGLDSGMWRVYPGKREPKVELIDVEIPALIVWKDCFQWEAYLEDRSLLLHTARIDQTFLDDIRKSWGV